MAKLVLFTENYPYSNSENFLETEILYLSQTFEYILVIPLNGTGAARTMPNNCILSAPLNSHRISRWISYLAGLLCLKLIFTEPLLRYQIRKFGLFKSIKYTGLVWLLGKRIKLQIRTETSIFYSYWMNYSAAAVAIYKTRSQLIRFVSRIHRFDLYSGLGENALDFFKTFTISKLDKLYPISEEGQQYLSRHYPGQKQKLHLARLGTRDPKTKNPENISEGLVILSCSLVKPVKRVNLIPEAILEMVISNPQYRITWHHIGEGPEFENVRSFTIENLKNTNIEYHFHGTLTNEQIYRLYSSIPVDVFLNVSQTEGIPVSIMEAQSFGIPVIATSAGGNPEIVDNINGLLIPVDIQPSDLARVLIVIYNGKNEWGKKRNSSRKNWETNYNADRNYREFAENLISIARLQ